MPRAAGCSEGAINRARLGAPGNKYDARIGCCDSHGIMSEYRQVGINRTFDLESYVLCGQDARAPRQARKTGVRTRVKTSENT